jgi:hypothetical protein
LGTSDLKILLSAKRVKAKSSSFAGQVADFQLKCSVLMENPKSRISGSYPQFSKIPPIKTPI